MKKVFWLSLLVLASIIFGYNLHEEKCYTTSLNQNVVAVNIEQQSTFDVFSESPINLGIGGDNIEVTSGMTRRLSATSIKSIEDRNQKERRKVGTRQRSDKKSNKQTGELKVDLSNIWGS